MRDQKVTRAIGITSHTDPAVLKMALSEMTSTVRRWHSTRRGPEWRRRQVGSHDETGAWI